MEARTMHHKTIMLEKKNLFAYLVVPRIGPVQIPLLLQDILGFCQAITLVKLRKK